MKVQFTSKKIKTTEAVKNYAKDRLEKLDRYAPKLVESHVILKQQKYFFEAEVTLFGKNLRAYGEGRSKENIYVALDQACSRVEKQLKKYREKVKAHHKAHGERVVSLKTLAAREAEAYESVPVEEKIQRPKIVSSKDYAPKPMSAREASLQLEISQKPFLVFLNASTQKTNIIHAREDGSHGLIEPNF